MMLQKKLFAFVISLFMFYTHEHLMKLLPVYIEGTVLDERSNKAISNIYVYTVKGEEEDLSNDKGEFTIKSWQKLPYT